MMDSTSMSTPVTRGELQEVLSQVKQDHRRELREVTAPLPTKVELQQEIQTAVAPLATKIELAAAVAPLATKVELEMWGGAVVARFQHAEKRLDNLQEQLIGLVQQTQQQIQQTEQRLLIELARHTSAILETMRAELKASTERFDDLPGRVHRLETEVFGPASRHRRKRRRSN
jgi:predicted O-linked N-acetylglucosamine transferase (SPINDLY family)